MSRDIAPFGLRMPDDLKKHLQANAKANSRSLNAEIVLRLDKTVKMDEGVYKQYLAQTSEMSDDEIAYWESEALKQKNPDFDLIKEIAKQELVAERSVVSEPVEQLADRLVILIEDRLAQRAAESPDTDAE